MPKQTRRIFIDCSFINFSKQPTGIPRVVLKYIEVGYGWGARQNVEVIPVVPTREALVLCRPVPGRGVPRHLIEKARESDTRTPRSSIEAMAKVTLGYLRDVSHHALFLAASLLPIPPVKSGSVWIDDAVKRGCAAFEEYVERQRTKLIQYAPQTGDVLFAPAYWHDVDPEIYASLRAKGMKVVILVHDLLPIVYENFYPSPWRYQFKENVCKAFGYASAFFCVSNLTKAALNEFGQRQKLQPVPMMTAYNGFEPLVSDAIAEQIRQGAVRPVMGSARFYAITQMNPLLMVGSVEPKKGHIPVIRCLEAMWAAGYERPLLIIGRTGWMERDVVAAIEKSPFYNRKLFWFTDIDDFDLATAYLLCHALVFSSLSEGFGIPMIESSYYGKPTIAYDTPIVREVLGSRALLFSSAHGLVQHLDDLEDAGKYADACEAAQQLKWPTWNDYAPRIFDLLMAVAKGDGRLAEQIASYTGTVPPQPMLQPVAA